MATLCQTPIRIYNTGKRKYHKHKYNTHRSRDFDDKDETIKILKTENEKSCLNIFKSNNFLGSIIFVNLFIGKLIA